MDDNSFTCYIISPSYNFLPSEVLALTFLIMKVLSVKSSPLGCLKKVIICFPLFIFRGSYWMKLRCNSEYSEVTLHSGSLLVRLRWYRVRGTQVGDLQGKFPAHYTISPAPYFSFIFKRVTSLHKELWFERFHVLFSFYVQYAISLAAGLHCFSANVT